MIKFLAHRDGRAILGIGLSHQNIDLLMKGHPIHFNAEQMGLSRVKVHEVIIFTGETEQTMRLELENKGYLKGARIIDDTRTRPQ